MTQPLRAASWGHGGAGVVGGAGGEHLDEIVLGPVADRAQQIGRPAAEGGQRVVDPGRDHREVTVNAADPGNVATGFGRNGGAFRFFQGPARFLLASPERGARTAVRLAGDPALDTATGGYYAKGRPARSSATSRDPRYGDQVLAMTARLLIRSGIDLGLPDEST
ncbi:hypothetical protein ACFO1B_14665 [Dactylosporangium siamense]|uniref:Uncharacterized protein n=1 Tax=Dactylosporangium siamense TaxID=685454 RepID=A0A919PHQ5_9ACTN|nr:hypothetical protein [Dactylosporangium siamense]GIG45075.1 hypothetical protein Dsi01nite_031160 [Dactylosporangium siamense]